MSTSTAKASGPLASVKEKGLKYLGVSVINVVVGQGLLLTFHAILGWPQAAANALAVMISAFPAYYLSRKWVWGKSGKSHFKKEVLPFWIFVFIGLVFSTAMVAIGAHLTDTAGTGSPVLADRLIFYAPPELIRALNQAGGRGLVSNSQWRSPLQSSEIINNQKPGQNEKVVAFMPPDLITEEAASALAAIQQQNPEARIYYLPGEVTLEALKAQFPEDNIIVINIAHSPDGMGLQIGQDILGMDDLPEVKGSVIDLCCQIADSPFSGRMIQNGAEIVEGASRFITQEEAIQWLRIFFEQKKANPTLTLPDLIDKVEWEFFLYSGKDWLGPIIVPESYHVPGENKGKGTS